MPKDILKKLCSGLPLNPVPSFKKSRNTHVPHAPDRNPSLSVEERKVIILNVFFFLILFKKLILF